MKIKTLIIVIVSIAFIVGCYFRYQYVKKNANLLSQRARHSLSLGNQYAPGVALCFYNQKNNGFKIASFIYHCVQIAQSPLRCSFIIINDLTASVSIKDELTHLLSDLSFRVEIREDILALKSSSYFQYMKAAKSLIENETAVAFCDPQYIQMQPNWDTEIINFINKNKFQSNNKAVFSSRDPSYFSVLYNQKTIK